MGISDWSSDGCSSDLGTRAGPRRQDAPMGFLAVLLSALIILAPGFALRPTPEAVDAGVTIALGEPARDDSDLPPISGALDPDRPLVVIDAGHGGEDPGDRKSTRLNSSH